MTLEAKNYINIAVIIFTTSDTCILLCNFFLESVSLLCVLVLHEADSARKLTEPVAELTRETMQSAVHVRQGHQIDPRRPSQ